MRGAVFAWVMQHGYLGLSSLLMLGIVGLPVPDETLLVFSGYLVYRGDLGLIPTVLAAFAGSVVGISLSYTIGRRIGRGLIGRYGHFIHLDPARMERISEWYARGGNWSLTVGYFIPGFRHVGAMIAGASGVPARSLALYAYSGALAWVATFVTLGRAFGREWQGISEEIHHHLLIATAVFAVVLAVYWLIRRVKTTEPRP